jgi:hypothetical protein
MAARGRPEVAEVVRWYFDKGRVEGVPFYCDPTRIGAFAIEPDELAAGSDAAVFRLFVSLAMYQALRDVVIMRQQRPISNITDRCEVPGSSQACAPDRRGAQECVDPRGA